MNTMFDAGKYNKNVYIGFLISILKMNFLFLSHYRLFDKFCVVTFTEELERERAKCFYQALYCTWEPNFFLPKTVSFPLHVHSDKSFDLQAVQNRIHANQYI